MTREALKKLNEKQMNYLKKRTNGTEENLEGS